MVTRALEKFSGARVIVADGGLRLAKRFHRMPHVIIGDMDSVNAQSLEALQQAGVTILAYPRDKNETDLELCFLYAVAQGIQEICVVGAIGGRFDQMMANVLLLAMPPLAPCDVEIVAGKQSIRLIMPHRTQTIFGAVGDTLSLIPLHGDAVGVTTQGLQYALSDETLFFGKARGVSNVLDAPTAHITLKSGVLLVVHTVGTPD